MKTLINKFNAPQGTVQLSNIVVDCYAKHFTATIGFKAKGKRKFNYKAISGTITRDIAAYFSELRDETIKVEAINEQGFILQKTGRKLTNFQRYLAKRDIDITLPLDTMVFEDDNYSDTYPQNPFKVVTYLSGKITLSLINIKSKVVKSTIDPVTGVVTDRFYNPTYIDKNGVTRKSYVSPNFYRRLIIEEEVEVEVFQNQTTS